MALADRDRAGARVAREPLRLRGGGLDISSFGLLLQGEGTTGAVNFVCAFYSAFDIGL